MDLKSTAVRLLQLFGFLPGFSAAALEQAARARVPTGQSEDVADLRALLWCSIDNDDSRDLDQLTAVKASATDDPTSDGKGAITVLVAIADVDALVKCGTPLDDHAATNTTSLYTAAGIFPMLPERLSTDLTSLNAGVERLAVVVEMTVSDTGEIQASSVYRARVFNRAKLAYRSVAAWLDGVDPPPSALRAVPGLEEALRAQDRASAALRRTRQERGALSLETTQARLVFNGNQLSDVRDERKNRAQQLIEDLMIAANGVTARFLVKQGFPALRRALRPPERWDRIRALAQQSGDSLPAAPDGRALDAFLRRQREAAPERFADLSLAVVKLIGAGEYVLELPGQPSEAHFGLAAPEYTHSTAPNRRFPDLVTQRLLKAALAGSSAPYSPEKLRVIAAHCSDQERKATKLERQINKSAAALLLAGRVGEQFDAIVTGASAKGTWVRISKPAVEGKVVNGFEGLDVGDRLRVRLERVDSEQGFIDFSRSAPAPT